MSERTYEELLKENQELASDCFSQKVMNTVLLSFQSHNQRKYCTALLNWSELRNAENFDENFKAQTQSMKEYFPELFEESRSVLPTFAPVGKARRRGFSEAARGIMGLRR